MRFNGKRLTAAVANKKKSDSVATFTLKTPILSQIQPLAKR